MYKPESFSGSKEVDVEKSTELPRTRSQIFGNKALKAAELYKRREELLKKKAELEKSFALPVLTQMKLPIKPALIFTPNAKALLITGAMLNVVILLNLNPIAKK
ncbi:hypothetical protein IJG93_02695 [Candidatus Saccharibacteria bacterium]|nr:hypothetical protein [Candidatus Saccharibacteria bacterium]